MITCPIRARCAGFTLLEILIAIVIFSIGLLGIAGLQVNGMRFTQDSQLRATAIAQAEAMADRMRTNRRGLLDDHYNITGTMPSALVKDCNVDPCTPEDLATFDLVTWNTALDDDTHTRESNADVLPGGTGVVCIDSTPDDGDAAGWSCDNAGGIYAIKVHWTERTVGADDVADTEDTSEKQVFVRVIPYADLQVDSF